MMIKKQWKKKNKNMKEINIKELIKIYYMMNQKNYNNKNKMHFKVELNQMLQLIEMKLHFL